MFNIVEVMSHNLIVGKLKQNCTVTFHVDHLLQSEDGVELPYVVVPDEYHLVWYYKGVHPVVSRIG